MLRLFACVSLQFTAGAVYDPGMFISARVYLNDLNGREKCSTTPMLFFLL
jgi:hypothetical protein